MPANHHSDHGTGTLADNDSTPESSRPPVDSVLRPVSSRSLVDLIASRHSTRTGWLDVPVPRATLQSIVRAGLTAPSSKNSQPWKLWVVTDRKFLSRVANHMCSDDDAAGFVPSVASLGDDQAPPYVSSVQASATILKEVHAAVFVENLRPFSSTAKEATFEWMLETFSLGACVENMWLASTALGVGAVFLADVVIAEPFLRQRLDLSGDIIGALALGISSLARPTTNTNEPWQPTRNRVAWV